MVQQMGVIDQDGNVLFNDLFRPAKKKRWPEAERVNHITPEMVAGKQTFKQRKDEIQAIFNKADVLVAYNASFDMYFLDCAGIVFPKDAEVSDPMLDFAEVYGEWSEYHLNYKWQKLSTAAAYYGYRFSAHDALEDIRATRYNCSFSRDS